MLQKPNHVDSKTHFQVECINL